jgi:mersacidin/lichenicidin family type 2 lantibiotic
MDCRNTCCSGSHPNRTITQQFATHGNNVYICTMKGNTYMKFDIARAWKDENYRQTLSEEQLNMLPAHPAGEMDEVEMEKVCGGGGFEGTNGFLGVGAASSSSSSHAAFSNRTHSFGLICDINIFSLNAVQIPIIPIASPTSQTCEECD